MAKITVSQSIEDEVRALKGKPGNLDTYLALSRIFGNLVMHAILPREGQRRVADAFRVQANNLGFSKNAQVADFLRFLGPSEVVPKPLPHDADGGESRDRFDDGWRN